LEYVTSVYSLGKGVAGSKQPEDSDVPHLCALLKGFATDNKSDKELRRRATNVQMALLPWSFGGDMSSVLPKHKELINAMVPLLRNNFASDKSAHSTWPAALMATVMKHAASKQPAEGLLVTCTLDYVNAKYGLHKQAVQPAEDDKPFLSALLEVFAPDAKSDAVLKEKAKHIQTVLLPWSWGGSMVTVEPTNIRLRDATLPLLRSNFDWYPGAGVEKCSCEVILYLLERLEVNEYTATVTALHFGELRLKAAVHCMSSAVKTAESTPNIEEELKLVGRILDKATDAAAIFENVDTVRELLPTTFKTRSEDLFKACHQLEQRERDCLAEQLVEEKKLAKGEKEALEKRAKGEKEALEKRAKEEKYK
jgi:hypothetical protein